MSHYSNDFSNLAEFDALAQSISAKLRCDMSLISIVSAEALIALGYSNDTRGLDNRSFNLRDTICGRTVAAGKPLRINNAKSDPNINSLPAVQNLNIGAYLGVPLVVEGRGIVGAVCAITTSARIWQDGEVDYLLAVGDLVESKIERHLLRYEQKALSAALAENDAILTMLSQMEGKAMTVHNAAGELVFANNAMRNDLKLNTQEMLSLPQVARHLLPEITHPGGVDVSLPVPMQTALNVQVSACENGLTLAEWSRKPAE
ncbi:GAF domain-containing protein [uncultured Tateyamaria sp.]|uniref:GAF domain-containing protein n=1 Tax=uncultured Tateyamaria sp. TaxID=455651 RepID=UPI0026148A07|nr:GAF domain-containing protein [uncultured Tateyamaria sp.]